MNWEISNRHSTGWAPFHNGNRPKPICGMAIHRSPLPTMAEFQISRGIEQAARERQRPTVCEGNWGLIGPLLFG